jgi:hypothetical protein
MISIIFIIIAAICNAIMDVLSHQYDASIFTKYNNPQYWDARISWRNKYNEGFPHLGRVKSKFLGIKFNKHVALTDAWHLFKTIMVISICLAIVNYQYINWIYSVVELCLLGITWNFVFVLFYKEILKN